MRTFNSRRRKAGSKQIEEELKAGIVQIGGILLVPRAETTEPGAVGKIWEQFEAAVREGIQALRDGESP